jgi:hypothetical protein
MMIVPATALGALVVFAAGYLLTEAVFRWGAKRRTPKDKLSRLEPGSLPRVDTTNDKLIETYALIGGGAAVLLLVLSFFLVPRLWVPFIWAALTLAGVGFAIFLNEDARSQTRANTKGQSPPLSEVPPREEDHVRQPPRATARPSPSPREDPYRTLLAKTLYDQAIADRLIAAERQHMPRASLDDLCRSILARMQREGPDPK